MKKKHAAQANITEETNGFWDVLIASTKGKHSHDWFLDYGCSYHMWPKKSWLYTCKDYKKEQS